MSYSKRLSSHVNATRFTQEEKRFIRTAMADPNIDVPTGVPDDIADNTVVKKIQQEYVLNMHDYAATDGTQVDIISWPMLRPNTSTLCSVGRENECAIPGDTNIFMGGVGVYVNKEDESPFYSGIGDSHWDAPINGMPDFDNYGRVICIDDEFLGGRCRMIGRSIKVVNEGPETYQSGTVRAWEQPIPSTSGNYQITESSIKLQNSADAQVARVRLETDHTVYAPIPASNQQQQNLRRTKLVGHARDGVFMIDAVDFENSTTTPTKRDLIWDEGGELTVTPGNRYGGYNNQTVNTRMCWIQGRLVAGQCVNYLTNYTAESNTVDGQNPRNYYMGNRLRGIRFSGLNTGKDGAPGPAVLRILVTTIIEQIPSNRDGNMASIAKKSPDPNPNVLDYLYEMQGMMEFAWAAKVNGMGTFTKALTDMLSTKMPNNKFTRAFDNSGVSKGVKSLLLNGVGDLMPGGTAGVAVAKYADAIAKGQTNKQAKQAVKQHIAPIAKMGKQIAKEAIKTNPTLHAAQMTALWTQKHGSSSWPTSKERKKWATEMYSFHLKNKTYRFPPNVWQDVMDEMNKPALRGKN